MKNEILNDGVDKAEITLQKRIDKLRIKLAWFIATTLVLTIVLFVNTRHTDAYESRIKQLDSLNLEQKAMIEILNNNLINK